MFEQALKAASPDVSMQEEYPIGFRALHTKGLGRGDNLRAVGIPKPLQIRFKAVFWRSALEGEVLRDDQWERIRPFVPGGRKGKRGPRSDGRRFFDALLWLARSGGRWRDLPERFGPYQRAKRRYYRWIEAGVFDRLFEAAAEDPDLEWVAIDATVIRAQAQAAGARRKRGDLKPRLSAAHVEVLAPNSTLS
jgi:transposase